MKQQMSVALKEIKFLFPSSVFFPYQVIAKKKKKKYKTGVYH